MTNLEKILNKIVDAPDAFISDIPEIERNIYKNVLSLVKELKTDQFGKFIPSVENIKKVNEISLQLKKIVFSRDYLNSVKDFAKEFRNIQSLETLYFNLPKSKISRTITDIAIDNTLEHLTGNGFSETIIRSLRRTILTAVTSGGKFSDLSESLREELTGVEDRPGALSKYSRTYVTSAMAKFSAEHTKLITEDLNMEWFQYVGSNIETTREFCHHLTKKRYVHKSEIPEIVSGVIDGHHCELGTNGLPRGMFDDTTPETFEVNRGGWNCGHQLVPTKAIAVPKHIRDRIKTEDDIKQRRDLYEKLRKDPDYNDVKFNPANGGLMATHKDHNFDHQKGWYEKNVQRVGYNNGNSVIFGSEAGQPDGVKYTDGLWNGKKAEIRGAETGKPENIRGALKHGARKGETEIAIIYFPNGNFDKDNFYNGLSLYNGLKNAPGRQYKVFDRIVCIQGERVVLDIKHNPPE